MSPLHFLLWKIFKHSSNFWRKVALNNGQLHCTGVAFVSQPSRSFQNFYAIWLALTGSDVLSPGCTACKPWKTPPLACTAWKLGLRRVLLVALFFIAQQRIDWTAPRTPRRHRLSHRPSAPTN